MRRPLYVALFVICALGLDRTRAALFTSYAQVRASSDVYGLPSPELTRLMSLGYRAALADFVFAHVLVAYGQHFVEKRRFEHVADYLETVTELDPQFTQPYLYSDTLLTLQPEPPRQEDYLRARELLLKGTRALPYHQELWLVAGQFIAYVAPPHLAEPGQAAQWRLEGARLLARACELATRNQNIPYHCIAAAGLLNRAGQREALIEMLSRTLAVNDDEEIQRLALATLGSWVGERERERYEARAKQFDARWRAELPFISKERVLVLGPGIDAYACTGLPTTLQPDPKCVGSWADWAKAQAAPPADSR